LGKIDYIWANLGEIWAKIIIFGQILLDLGNQNLASAKTFDLLYGQYQNVLLSLLFAILLE